MVGEAIFDDVDVILNCFYADWAWALAHLDPFGPGSQPIWPIWARVLTHLGPFLAIMEFSNKCPELPSRKCPELPSRIFPLNQMGLRWFPDDMPRCKGQHLTLEPSKMEETSPPNIPPGSMIQDPGSRIQDPGSRIQDSVVRRLGQLGVFCPLVGPCQLLRGGLENIVPPTPCVGVAIRPY